jgi:predicted TIM-barrel fold metal-dependent hydrolase
MAQYFQRGMSKRFEGRDEPILDAGIPIIDAHHHLYDRANLRYLLEDYLEDADAGHDIVGTVYIETGAMSRTWGPQHLRPVGEVEFANGIGAMAASGRYGARRVCAAIVGHADLSAGDVVAELLDQALSIAPDRFRGVRQMVFHHPSEALARDLPLYPPGIMAADGFRRGFRHLAARRLSFDASIFHNQLPGLSALADAFPDTTIVLNHLGMAVGLGAGPAARAQIFHTWRCDLADLARRPNVVCKIGGLGVPVWGFGFEERPDAIGGAELAGVWRPYVEVAIAAFGVDRCLMESDYPSEGLACGFVPLWNALKSTVAGCTREEKTSLFHDVAARVYRIDGTARP